MTATTISNGNGQGRKTLASQLDRLDAVLDTLGEGLNEAVASAVQQAVELAVRQAVSQAVKEAVQAVLHEILSNPELRTALHNAAPDAPPAKTSPTCSAGAARSTLRWVGSGIKAGVGRVRVACRYALGRAAEAKPVARSAWGLFQRFKGRLLTACGVGVVIGLAAYNAGPSLNAAAGWLGGFVATLAVQARDSLRRLLPSKPTTE